MVVATDVDPGQHNFLSPLGHHLTHILQHLIGRATDSPSAHKGNDAKSTEIVAAVLYFHQTARMKHFGEGLVAEQIKIFIGKHRIARLQQGIHRSEEHTSELQSRPHLVCRLLLEKKKKVKNKMKQ